MGTFSPLLVCWFFIYAQSLQCVFFVHFWFFCYYGYYYSRQSPGFHFQAPNLIVHLRGPFLFAWFFWLLWQKRFFSGNSGGGEKKSRLLTTFRLITLKRSNIVREKKKKNILHHTHWENFFWAKLLLLLLLFDSFVLFKICLLFFVSFGSNQIKKREEKTGSTK